MIRTHVRKSLLVAALLPLQLAVGPASASDSATLKMGIVPQQSATRLAKIWVPFLSELSKKTGVKIQFTTAKDIPSFESCLASGAYDLAYMNPYHYTEFSIAPGYQAFAHQRGKQLKGILVAKKDANVTDLTDLSNKTLAFPSPAAFGASVLPRAEMTRQGIVFEPKYVKSHDSVYRAVAAGIYPAGGGVLRTWGKLPKDIQAQLKVFYTTQGYTPHAFAAHPRIDNDTVAKIADAMGGIDPKSPFMKSLGMKGIDKAANANWDDVRSLNLDRRQTQIREGANSCHSD